MFVACLIAVPALADDTEAQLREGLGIDAVTGRFKLVYEECNGKIQPTGETFLSLRSLDNRTMMVHEMRIVDGKEIEHGNSIFRVQRVRRTGLTTQPIFECLGYEKEQDTKPSRAAILQRTAPDEISICISDEPTAMPRSFESRLGGDSVRVIHLVLRTSRSVGVEAAAKKTAEEGAEVARTLGISAGICGYTWLIGFAAKATAHWV
jgi:hypothetical protein